MSASAASVGRALLPRIKEIVHGIDPTAQVILYGSYARNEEGPDSDIDLLILIDKEKVSHEDHTRLMYPLFDLEMKHGVIVSPRVLPKSWWGKPPLVTPFYENVRREGKPL